MVIGCLRYLAGFRSGLPLSYTRGPLTEMLLIDFVTELQCPLSKASKGFIMQFDSEPFLLVYRKVISSGPIARVMRIAYETLDRWSPIPKHRH